MKAVIAKALLQSSVMLLLCCITGCGSGESHSEPVAAAGIWNVDLDNGDGTMGHQKWTITQSGNHLSMTGEPSDDYGPSLDSYPRTGYAGDSGLWATWTKDLSACRYYSSLDVTITGNTLSGTLGWMRGSHGAGYCSPFIGTITLTGSR